MVAIVLMITAEKKRDDNIDQQTNDCNREHFQAADLDKVLPALDGLGTIFTDIDFRKN